MMEWTSTGRTRVVTVREWDGPAELSPGERIARVDSYYTSSEWVGRITIEHTATRELADKLAALASGVIDRAVRRWAKRDESVAEVRDGR